MGVSGQRAARLLREVQKPILEQTPPPIVEVDCRVPGDPVLRSRPVPFCPAPCISTASRATVTRVGPPERYENPPIRPVHTDGELFKSGPTRRCGR